MRARAGNRLAARLAWLFAVWTIALSGCTVHHYHHYDAPPAEQPRVASAVVEPKRASRNGSELLDVLFAPHPGPAIEPASSPVTFPARSLEHHPSLDEIVWRRAGSPVVPVAYQPAANVPDRAVPALPLATPRPVPPAQASTPGEGAEVRLTVDQVINAVLVSDPKLRSGFEAINQANANALTASLRPNPTLFTDGQLMPLTRPFTVDAQGGPPQQDVQLGYPIDWYVFGKRSAGMAAAAHGVKVSEAEFADLVRQRVNDAAVAYYDVLEAKALLGLARQAVANMERVEAVLIRGIEIGTKAQLDLNRLRLDLLQSRQALREAEKTLATAKAKLRAMIGRSDADPNFDIDGSLDAALSPDPPTAEDGFDLAVQNRPDIQAIRWKGEQARANVLVEKRNACPSVTPAFGYTHQYQLKAIGFPDADSWSASLTMTLPVSDRNQGNRAKAASLVVQNRFDYQSALVDLRAEIETAAQEYRAARANAEAAAGEQLRIAQEVLDAITRAYDAGTRPLLDVLDAQRNFRETYRTYISSRANYWRAVYRYGAAMGLQVPR